MLMGLITVPIGMAALSPLLAWRTPIYIIASFAGIIALALLLVQTLAIKGLLPGLSTLSARYTHRWIGTGILCLVVIHVGGLWITSPWDVIDALLFRSPTVFAPWGVLAMWALFLSGVLALLRFRGKFPWRYWRVIHPILAGFAVIGTVVHAVYIEGTMEPISKALICGAVILASATVFWRRI